MRRFLVLISIIIVFCIVNKASAQGTITYPANDGDRLECKALIETSRGNVGGICVMLHDDDSIKGAIINEFGITALGFRYIISKDEMKLEDVNAMIDKWYIKMVLHKDLRELLHSLKDGRLTYTNEKYHITYTLSPMDVETDSDNDSKKMQSNGKD